METGNLKLHDGPMHTRKILITTAAVDLSRC